MAIVPVSLERPLAIDEVILSSSAVVWGWLSAVGEEETGTLVPVEGSLGVVALVAQTSFDIDCG
jgi:hypothetical protein